MKLEINFGKKHLFIFILVCVLVGGSIVYAALNPAIPNPGHAVSQLQKCGANEVLKMDSSGTAWGCGTGGGGIFVGATAGTYDGLDVGGYAGGNVKCDTQYPGSRMCYAGDFVNGLPDPSDGWYNTYVISYNPGATTTSFADCLGWTQEASWTGGMIWGSRPQAAACDQKFHILCCK